jgi:hypothetical protein
MRKSKRKIYFDYVVIDLLPKLEGSLNTYVDPLIQITMDPSRSGSADPANDSSIPPLVHVMYVNIVQTCLG